MELYKRKDGRSPWWQLDYVHPVTGDRKRVSLKVKGNKAEAQKAAVSYIADQKAAPNGAGYTLGQALQAYCTALHSEHKASAEEQDRLTRKCLGALEGRWGINPALPLTAVTSKLMGELVTARRAEGNANQTIAHEIKLVRAAVRLARANGHEVNMDMYSGVLKDAWRMPRLPQKTRYLTLEEFRLVYEHMAPGRTVHTERKGLPFTVRFGENTVVWRQRQDAQDLFVALALCGGRWSEVASLTWDRIDLDKGVIRLWGNKTQRERLVGIPDMLSTMLSRRLQTRKPGQPLVFPTLSGKARASTSSSIQKAFGALGLNSSERIGESGRATVHSLRHTFASLLAQNGADLGAIQDALGHTSLTMTRRYAHLLKTESAAKLAGILNGALNEG